MQIKQLFNERLRLRQVVESALKVASQVSLKKKIKVTKHFGDL